MKCIYHNNKDAVATCSDCGKGLCTDCAAYFEPPLCLECANARNSTLRTEAIKKIIAVVCGFFVGFIFACIAVKGNISFALASGIFGIVCVGIPSGWKFLNKITPDIFLFLPIIGWVIYFLIKGILSFLIGGIILPFSIAKAIIKLIKAKKMDAYIHGTEGMQ